MKILVVDDEYYNRQILRDIFEAKGCEVLEANNGKEGARLCLEQNPDVTITDMQMPQMTGEKMIAVVRHRRPWMKFIAVTGSNDGWKLPEDVELILKPDHLAVIFDKANRLVF